MVVNLTIFRYDWHQQVQKRAAAAGYRSELVWYKFDKIGAKLQTKIQTKKNRIASSVTTKINK